MNRADRADACRRMLAAHMSYNDISQALKMSTRTISAISRGERGYSDAKVGRPAKLTREMKMFINVNWLADARITDATMTCMVNDHFRTQVGITTVRRCRQTLGFEYRPPKITQDLSPHQKALRVSFCRWVLDHQHELGNFVFSDESRFQLGPDNQWRRIKRGHWNDTCFVTKTKFPNSCMVWGAIGVGLRSTLMMCSNSEDSTEYLQILGESGIFGQSDRIYGQGNWYFIQDGAPCHKSSRVTDWIDKQGVMVLPGWPPNSPDLNPIEMVWGIMKKRLRWEAETKKREEMFTQLKQVWEALDEGTLNALVRSFVRRCQTVLNLDGESATAYLSSHRVPRPVENPRPRREWSDADDRELRQLWESLGPRWKRIAVTLGREPIECKHRFQHLSQVDRNQQIFDRTHLADIDGPCPPLPADVLADEELDTFLARFQQ